jgi:hypothetical protein
MSKEKTNTYGYAMIAEDLFAQNVMQEITKDAGLT